MRRVARKTLAASAVAAIAIALAAMPSSADPATFDVVNGGSITGTESGDILFLGHQSGSTLVCESSTAVGFLESGSARPGTGIATLDSVSLSSPHQTNGWCVADGSIPTQVTAIGLPWSFDVTGKPAANTTNVRLNNVQLKMHAPSVPCDVTLGGPGTNGSGGYVEGTYTNPSTLTGNDGYLVVPYTDTSHLKVLGVSHPWCGVFSLKLGETVASVGVYTVVNDSGISPTIT